MNHAMEWMSPDGAGACNLKYDWPGRPADALIEAFYNERVKVE